MEESVYTFIQCKSILYMSLLYKNGAVLDNSDAEMHNGPAAAAFSPHADTHIAQLLLLVLVLKCTLGGRHLQGKKLIQLGEPISQTLSNICPPFVHHFRQP